MPGETESLESLGLGERINNPLRGLGVIQVGHLARVTRRDLLKTKNMGKGGVQKIEEALSQRGLSLAQEGGVLPPSEVEKLREEIESLRGEVVKLRVANVRLSRQLHALEEEVRGSKAGQPRSSSATSRRSRKAQ